MTDLFENAVCIRRKLHKQPELGWGEFCTTQFIIQELESLGWTVYTGTKQVNPEAVMGRDEKFIEANIKRAKSEGLTDEMLARMEGYTGCIAVWKTDVPGPVTALRFDIDCVGVDETDDPSHKPTAEGFRSVHPGAMHSCGHDGHTAIGLSVARWIADHADQLKGTIKLVFQPAEEGVRGGAAQAASGMVDDVDYILGSHLAVMCPTGEVCTNPQNCLATTKIDVSVTGRSTHPALSPELGRDAIACLCSMVGEIKGMSQHGKARSSVNIGRIEGGVARNVVAASAMMQMEVRGASDEVRNFMVEQATRIVKGTAIAYDCEYKITKAGEGGTMINDPELVDLVSSVAESLPGITVVREKDMSGSEDFTMLAARVQQHGGKADYFVVGADREGSHHQKNFDFDEKALGTAIEIFTGCVAKLNFQ